MKVILTVLIAALFISDIDRIALINSLKSDARKAYQSGDYKTAIQKYQYLMDSLQVKEDEVLMNLANAYFQENDTVSASPRYKSLTQSKAPKLRSLSNQQLGVMANRLEKYEEALNYFKQALKADPTNEDARFNYEMVKKKLEEQKKQEEQNKDQDKKDQDKKDEQDKDSKDKKDQDQKKDQQDKQDQDKKDQQDQQDKDKQEQDKKDKEKSDQEKEQEQQEENKEKKDIPPSVSDKLKEMEMSEEKAKMILEAMKNQEIQYLQQNKRKATKPKDKTKPDW